METARRLDIQYLRIDSLCIVQDDDEDWRTEPSIMADIYQGAILNIAATRAVSGDDGLFALREVQAVTAKAVSGTWLNCDGGTYYFRDDKLFERLINNSPLLSRGWVTQEVVCARRILHFCQDRMVWVCSALQTEEDFPGGLPLTSHRKLNASAAIYTDDFIVPGIPDSAYRQWYRFIDQYSAASLSYPVKDKLVAISSVARKLIPDDTLIGGLWKSQMPQDLLWGISEMSTPSEHYQAPSWSWAVLNGACHADGHYAFQQKLRRGSHYRITGEVLQYEESYMTKGIFDINLSHQNDDPTKPITRGELKMETRLMKGSIQYRRDLPRRNLFQIGNRLFHYDGFRFPESQPAFLVSILRKTYRDANETILHGLVLRPTGVNKGEYTRIGSFRLGKSWEIHAENNNLMEFVYVLMATGTTDEQDYEEVNRMGKFPW